MDSGITPENLLVRIVLNSSTVCRKKRQDIFICSNDGFLNTLINDGSAAEPSVHKMTHSTYFKCDTE